MHAAHGPPSQLQHILESPRVKNGMARPILEEYLVVPCLCRAASCCNASSLIAAQRKGGKKFLCLQEASVSLLLHHSSRTAEAVVSELQMPTMELVLGLSESRRWPGWPTSIALRVDTGSPWMNRAVHGFLNVGAVAACKAAAEDTAEYLSKGRASKHRLEHALKKMCKEGAYWGAVGGVYEAVEYGVEQIRGRNGWTNAAIGGAITGALISAAAVLALAGAGTENNYRGKVIKGAITGGAVATAAELISQRGRVALAAPMTFGGGTANSGSSNAGSWEWQRHDDDIVDEDPLAVARGGLEPPSAEIDCIPGWPGTF